MATGKNPPKLSPEAAKIREALLATHEATGELGAMGTSKAHHPFTTSATGHQRPRAFLDEVSLIASIPDKKVREEVINYWAPFRRKPASGMPASFTEAGMLEGATGGRISYEKPFRLSRHAKRRISDLIEQGVKEDTGAAMREAQEYVANLKL
jgi:hypothetical protein